MSKKNDGGQAFPCMYPNADNLGMTLRDYFAAKIVAAIAGRDMWLSAHDAERAYQHADAMIAARSRPQRKDGDE
jgi:hypothetical protein